MNKFLLSNLYQSESETSFKSCSSTEDVKNGQSTIEIVKNGLNVNEFNTLSTSDVASGSKIIQDSREMVSKSVTLASLRDSSFSTAIEDDSPPNEPNNLLQLLEFQSQSLQSESQKSTRLITENAQLYNDNINYILEIKQLKHELKQLEFKAVDCDELLRMKNLVKELKQEVGVKDSEMEGLRVEIRDLKTGLLKLGNELEEKNTRNDSLRIELETLKESKQITLNLTQQINDLSLQLNKAQLRESKFKDQKQSFMEKHKQLNELYSKEKSGNEKLLMENEMVKREVEMARLEIENGKKAGVDKENELVKEKQALKDQLVKVDKEKQSLKDALVKLDKERQDLKDQLVKVDKENKDSTIKMAKENQVLKDTLAKTDQKIKAMESEISNTTKKMALNDRVKEAELKQAQSETMKLKETLSKIEKALKQQIQDLTLKMKIATAESKSQTESNKELISKVQDLLLKESVTEILTKNNNAKFKTLEKSSKIISTDCLNTLATLNSKLDFLTTNLDHLQQQAAKFKAYKLGSETKMKKLEESGNEMKRRNVEIVATEKAKIKELLKTVSQTKQDQSLLAEVPSIVYIEYQNHSFRFLRAHQATI